jgi:putative flippase GtrA
MSLALRYLFLALIATAANIGTQDIVIRAYHGPYAIPASVFVGTGIGLLLKYVLDKRYIFRFVARNSVHDAQTFVGYTMMGVGTTLLFWSFEFGFNHIFQTKEMRYVGAVIGLGLGYWVKYNLDKRYVFRAGMK